MLMIFDDDAFCIVDDDQSMMFDYELYKPAKLNDDHYHNPRSIFDCEILPHN